MVIIFFVVGIFCEILLSIETIGMIYGYFFCLCSEPYDTVFFIEEYVFVGFFIPEMTLDRYFLADEIERELLEDTFSESLLYASDIVFLEIFIRGQFAYHIWRYEKLEIDIRLRCDTIILPIRHRTSQE